MEAQKDMSAALPSYLLESLLVWYRDFPETTGRAGNQPSARISLSSIEMSSFQKEQEKFSHFLRGLFVLRLPILMLVLIF